MFVALGIISGCASLIPEPISTGRIVEVVDDAKRQVSIYVSYQNTHRIVSRGHYCGNGLIDFDIKQVKLDLLTTLDNTSGGGISVAGLPVAPGATLGFTLSETIENKNTQELIFVANPLPDPSFRYVLSEGEAPAPLAGVMASLRNGLILESNQRNRVCFQAATGDGGNSFKFAVTVVSDASGKLSLGLAPLSLSGSGENKATTGNTITFTFAPHVFGAVSKPVPKPKKDGA
jgi:hypothetical protein